MPIAATMPDATPDTLGISCAQIRGGNGRIHVPVDLPGLHGVLHSEPSDGGHGGDVHYLSVCGSGLLSRICLADVVGHGETVARVSAQMHALLQRYVSRPGHGRVLLALNAALREMGLDAMTTVAICTYYPPSRTLTFSYAGHPPGWFYRSRETRWEPLCAETPKRSGGFVDGALGISDEAFFTRSRRKVEHGDRLLLVTDGVLETPDPARELFGRDRVARILDTHRSATPSELVDRVLDALTRHHGGDVLDHDDVSILLAEFRPGPPGPALWHVLRNRMLRPLGLIRAPGARAGTSP